MNRQDIRAVVGAVLVNAANYPEAARPHILGRDLSVLIEKVTQAVLDAQAVERAEAPPVMFKKGDQVSFYEGMGETSLGVVRTMLPNGRVLVILDGYTDDEGLPHKPYGLPIPPHSLRKINPEDLAAARKADADRMRPGFTPIHAEVDDDPFV